MPLLTPLKLRLLSRKQRFLLCTVISILSICSSFHLLQKKKNINAGFLKSYLGIPYRNFQINHSLSPVCNGVRKRKNSISVPGQSTSRKAGARLPQVIGEGRICLVLHLKSKKQTLLAILQAQRKFHRPRENTSIVLLPKTGCKKYGIGIFM